jgi:hypothetical protein
MCSGSAMVRDNLEAMSDDFLLVSIDFNLVSRVFTLMSGDSEVIRSHL